MRRFENQRLRGNGSLYVCSQGVIRLAGEGETWDVHSSQLEYSSAASAPLTNTEPQLHVVFYEGKQIMPQAPAM